MLLRQVLLVAVAVGVTSHAVGQEASPAEPAAPQAATPAPPPPDAKPVSEAPAAPPTAGNTESVTEGKIDADKIMAMQKAGYQIKNENGQILLCRQDLQTGSRLRKKTSCMTAREWEQLQKDSEQQLKAIERRPRMVNQ